MSLMVYITSQLGKGICKFGFRAWGTPNRRSTRQQDVHCTHDRGEETGKGNPSSEYRSE